MGKVFCRPPNLPATRMVDAVIFFDMPVVLFVPRTELDYAHARTVTVLLTHYSLTPPVLSGQLLVSPVVVWHAQRPDASSHPPASTYLRGYIDCLEGVKRLCVFEKALTTSERRYSGKAEVECMVCLQEKSAKEDGSKKKLSVRG